MRGVKDELCKEIALLRAQGVESRVWKSLEPGFICD